MGIHPQNVMNGSFSVRLDWECLSLFTAVAESCHATASGFVLVVL